jgi:hypothetical protein
MCQQWNTPPLIPSADSNAAGAHQGRPKTSLRANTDNVVSTLPGWISTSFVVSHDKRHILIYSQWRDLA